MSKFEYKPESGNVSIVIVGAFNPLMFHPEWFLKNNVVAPGEIEAIMAKSTANNEDPFVVTPNFTIFSTSQLLFNIFPDKFSITAIKEPFSIAQDAVKKTFENLGSMPMKAMGINSSAHFKMLSLSKYQEFGDRLTPKNYWEYLLKDEVKGDDRKSGLAQLTMKKERKDPKGAIVVSVGPSGRFFPEIPGVYILCNDHYDFDKEIYAEKASYLLDKYFDASLQESLKIQMSLFEGL